MDIIIKAQNYTKVNKRNKRNPPKMVCFLIFGESNKFSENYIGIFNKME